jgi:hypothetical protein
VSIGHLRVASREEVTMGREQGQEPKEDEKLDDLEVDAEDADQVQGGKERANKYSSEEAMKSSLREEATK